MDINTIDSTIQTSKKSKLLEFVVAFLFLDMFEVIIIFLTQKIINIEIISLIFNILKAVFSLYFIYKLLQYKTKFINFAITAYFILMLYAASITLNPTILTTVNRDLIVGFVGSWISAIAVGILLHQDERNFFDVVIKFLPLIYIYLFVSFLLFDLEKVYQNIAYNILVFAVASLEIFFRKKKAIMLINVIILAVLLLLTGSRGPILSFVVFGLWLFWEYSKKSKIWRYVTVSLVGTGTFYLILLYKEVQLLLSKIFPGNRIIEMITSGELFVSGRNQIYQYSIEELQNRWFNFGGMMADRFFLVDTFYNTNKLGFWIVEKNYHSVYAHNIFLELCFCFGTFFGIIISVILVLEILKHFIFSGDYDRSIMIMLICIGFIPLLFTSSLWASTYFWILIGFMLGVNYENKFFKITWSNLGRKY